MQVEWCRRAKRTFRQIVGILSHIFRFEDCIAMQAVNILSHVPLVDRIAGVQPTDTFLSIHNQFRLRTEFIFKQSPPTPATRAWVGNCFPGDNWQHCRSLDDAISPVRSVYGPYGLASAGCESNAVCAVIPDTVAASREFVLLRFSLSLTASHSY